MGRKKYGKPHAVPAKKTNLGVHEIDYEHLHNELLLIDSHYRRKKDGQKFYYRSQLRAYLRKRGLIISPFNGEFPSIDDTLSKEEEDKLRTQHTEDEKVVDQVAHNLETVNIFGIEQ